MTFAGLMVTAVHAELNATGSSSTTTAFPASGTDLGKDATFTFDQGTKFNPASVNDGAAVIPRDIKTITYLTDFPNTVTVNLNGTFDLASISVLMGWKGAGSKQVDQDYTIQSSADGTSYTDLKAVSYQPFTGKLLTTAYHSRVVIDDDTGAPLAKAVSHLKFIFNDPGKTATHGGTTLSEIDINRVGTNSLTITNLGSRSIIQRKADNSADIPISGDYIGSPDRIEARAVVMAGADKSGTSTAWQTIVNKPAVGKYAGSLTGVAAGAWYQLELRSVSKGIYSDTVILQKIGVGDIFVIAGQSNSANFGQAPDNPADDRISMRNSVSENAWIKLQDPLAIASGSGGSTWSRLGQIITKHENIPVGFISVGVGSTQSSHWLPASKNYHDRLKPAVQSFPATGFRAVLWHQGESDAIAQTTAAAYTKNIQQIIAQTRADSGWDVPWFLAEAAFHPATSLRKEEPVAAGQRAAVYANPLVHLGPSTDEFHLENAHGSKLTDSVHFNSLGLADHAAQWHAILYDEPALTLENGDFEKNTTDTTSAALADDGVSVVDITALNSPSVLDWRILSSSGNTAADGSNGYYNPGTSFYTKALDSENGGILGDMIGKHAAFLSQGSAGNYFLQTRRHLLKSHRKYTLTVAIGVRDVGTEAFGNATLEILANGAVMKSTSFAMKDLDALAGGKATGKFTDVSITFIIGETVDTDQPLAVKIAKANAGGYLDFDNVRFSEAPTAD